MSAAEIGAGRHAMNSMPATALMTVWPEETVVPTTRSCAKVCKLQMFRGFCPLLISPTMRCNEDVSFYYKSACVCVTCVKKYEHSISVVDLESFSKTGI